MEIEALADVPELLRAAALIVCVPCVIFLPCHVTEQEVVFVHVCSGLPSTVIEIDAIPLLSLAEAAILTLPFPLSVVPFDGALIATIGADAREETRPIIAGAEVLPAASYATTL